MKTIIIAILGVLVITSGIYTYSYNRKVDAMIDKNMAEKETMMEAEKGAVKEEEMTKNENSPQPEASNMMPMKEEEDMMSKGGRYEAYAHSKIARAEEGDVVLFFKASWCPGCRALDADIKANISRIREDVTILEVNYDTETALKKKHGVTYQHTLVQVDRYGDQINKWSGSSSLSDLLSEVQ